MWGGGKIPDALHQKVEEELRKHARDAGIGQEVLRDGDGRLVGYHLAKEEGHLGLQDVLEHPRVHHREHRRKMVHNLHSDARRQP
jgi:hypothetical protein